MSVLQYYEPNIKACNRSTALFWVRGSSRSNHQLVR